jgi:hypothetical protein
MRSVGLRFAQALGFSAEELSLAVALKLEQPTSANRLSLSRNEKRDTSSFTSR